MSWTGPQLVPVRSPAGEVRRARFGRVPVAVRAPPCALDLVPSAARAAVRTPACRFCRGDGVAPAWRCASLARTRRRLAVRTLATGALAIWPAACGPRCTARSPPRLRHAACPTGRARRARRMHTASAPGAAVQRSEREARERSHSRGRDRAAAPGLRPRDAFRIRSGSRCSSGGRNVREPGRARNAFRGQLASRRACAASRGR